MGTTGSKKRTGKKVQVTFGTGAKVVEIKCRRCQGQK